MKSCIDLSEKRQRPIAAAENVEKAYMNTTCKLDFFGRRNYGQRGISWRDTDKRCRSVIAFVLICFTICLLSIADARAQNPEPAVNRVVRVGIYVSPPFVMVDDSGGYAGMAIDLWDAVAQKLSLATRHTVYPTFKDLVDAVRTGDVDVAVTNVTITSERAAAMSFTQPWFDAGLRIMVPDQDKSGFWDIVAGLGHAGHLHAYAWLLFVILVATVGLTLFDRRFDPAFPKRWREGLAESLYQVIATAMSGRLSRKNLFGWMGRIWSVIWMICGMAVIAYITSSVTSVMTAMSIDRGINSIADLSGRTAGVLTGSVGEAYVIGLGIASRPYPDIAAAVAAMKADEVDAIVADAPTLEYYAHSRSERNVTVVGNIFHPDKYGFAFPADSDLAKPVAVEILRLHENGTVAKLRLKYFGNML